MDAVNNICFKRSEFTLYLVLIIFILTYFLYIIYYQYKEDSNSHIQNQLQQLQRLQQQSSQQQLQQLQRLQQQSSQQVRSSDKMKNNNVLLDRIYNPIIAPERSYPGGRLGLHSQNQYNDYQQIGFIYNDKERYPLYGRPKYPRKLDKFEYYIIDETRNHLKIPYKSNGDNEIFDGDQIFIDVLNDTFTVKIYDYDNIRYNPDIY